MSLAKRISRIGASATLAMSARARKLQAEGRSIINLSLGEPDFDTPGFIKKAAIKAVEQNYTHYMPVPGYPDLREAVSHKFRRDNGLDYKSSQICVSTGAKQSLANAILSIVDHGDEVLLPAPYWVTYVEIIRLAGAVPVVIPSGIDADFKISAEQLEEYITPKTRMLIFSSPSNPTGAMYLKEEFEEIACLLARHPDIWVVSDEIYEHIRYDQDHLSFASLPGMFDRTITVNGVSKAFAMTGWRVGYLAAPQQIADACIKLQGQFTSGTSSIAQRAALAAVSADPKIIDPFVIQFRKRRDLIRSLLSDLPGMRINNPPGAFYLFPDISEYIGKSFKDKLIKDDLDLTTMLLEESGVALVQGTAFGAPDHIRISYAASEDQLREAANRIRNTLSDLTV